MEEYYYCLGGLPRYLNKSRGRVRKNEMTLDKVSQHSEALLNALAYRKGFFRGYRAEKIDTRFFTLCAGEDENWYNPSSEFTTLDFVSPAAFNAVGRIILERMYKDCDASDIGLAFERLVLMFLAQGTEGMEGMARLGIQTRCRQLLKRPQHCNDVHAIESTQAVQFVWNGSKIEKAPNDFAFESKVRGNGKGFTFSTCTLTANKTLVVPTDGYRYSNDDGMILV